MTSISGNHVSTFFEPQPAKSGVSGAKSAPGIPAPEERSSCLTPDQVQTSWSNKGSPEKDIIKIYTTYGTEKQVTLRGRVLLDKHPSAAKPSDSYFTNLVRNFGFLDSDEIRHAEVDVRFAGQTIRATTDRDGLFEIKLDLKDCLATGFHPVEAQLIPDPERALNAPLARGMVIIQNEHESSFGVISDVDDTIQYSHVSSKWEAFKTLLLGNETTLKEVPGMAALYQALDQANDGAVDGDITYLSGSPMNYVGRVENFLAAHDFPEGPIQLKNFGFREGEDNPFKQTDYKLNHLREVFDTYPQKSFLLFGDSGEKDPEIYRQIATEYPGRVQAILIHHVTSDAENDPRYQGLTVIKSGLDAAKVLHQKGILPDAGLAAVQEAMRAQKK